MSYVVVVAVVLLLVGLMWALHGGHYYSFMGWGAWSPNYYGIVLSLASAAILSAIGLMKLGAWLW